MVEKKKTEKKQKEWGLKKGKMIVDEIKPHSEIARDIPPVDMETGNIMDMLIDMFKEEKVDTVFALTSGVSFGIEGALEHAGIKRVHVRHEQAAGFAGDAYGRITKRPAVVITGDGTALGYVSAAIGQAYSAQSPMVHFVNKINTGPALDTFPPFGKFDPEHMLGGITKWVRRIDTPEYILFEMKRAFRDAITPPQGPCAVAVNAMIFLMETMRVQPKFNFSFSYKPGFFPPREHRTMADPVVVEEAMKWLMSAERPVIMAGEGIHYDDAVEELNEFVALTGIPCNARRISRGAFSEDNPLNCGRRARGRVVRSADRCLTLGLRITYLENFGNPPFWSHDARYCQVQTCGENINLQIPTEFELIGNMKLALRQMIDCVRAMGITKPPQKWNQWRQFVADARAEYWSRATERAKGLEGQLPLHPDLLGKNIGEFLREELNDDHIVIYDGLTAAGCTTDWITAVRPAQILDAAETIGLGHGIGMAIGAGMATDRRVPIVSLVGDGGIGCGGMDIETAARWDIPVLFILFNNSWYGGNITMQFAPKWFCATGDPIKDGPACLPDIRYDEMFKAFGCHGELVERDNEIKPALKKAMDYVRTKSKPAVVNCLTDPDFMHHIFLTLGGCAAMGFQPWEDVPEATQKRIIEDNLCPPVYLALVHPSWVEAILGGL